MLHRCEGIKARSFMSGTDNHLLTRSYRILKRIQSYFIGYAMQKL